MERIFNVAETIGTDVRSRSAANAIKDALNSVTPPTQISFDGVAFMSRSFTDELCAILDMAPTLLVTNMNNAVRTMFDVVLRSRVSERVRSSEEGEIRNFKNVKDFFAFMRKQL